MYCLLQLLDCFFHILVIQDVEAATNHLREYYCQSRYAGDLDDWPPYHPKHYTPLTIIHHEGRRTESEIITVAQELSSNRIAENREAYIDYDRTIKNINDLFTPYEGETSHPYRLLIEGAPGVGKTILSKEIAFQWANSTLLNSKKLLFLIFMRDPQVNFITDSMTLVKYFFQSDTLARKVTDWLVETDGKYLTIILDGYDEVSEDNKSHFLKDIINRKWLVKCGLVITSRPNASSNIHSIVDRRAEVLGFTEEDRKDFIKSALQGQTQKIKGLECFLTSNPFINTLCFIPLIMSILLCLTEDGINTLPKTHTKLFENFIIMTIVHFLKRDKKLFTVTITNFNDLPHPYDQVVKELSQFAFLALQKDQLVFTLAEIKVTCPNLTPVNWYGLGLLKHARYFKPQDGCDHESFHFLHFAVQEYMAAHYIASLPDKAQFKLLSDTFWSSQYCNTWIMYVGITGGDSFVFKHFLTGNYFQLSSRLLKASNISDSILNNKIKCLHLLHCLAEADHEMLSSVENIFKGGIIDLSYQSLTPNDVHTLAVLLLRSPSRQWEMINLSHCNIDEKCCNVLYELFHSHHVALNVIAVDISSNNLHWDSFRKLCVVLRMWNTKEIVLSISTLHDSKTVKLISDFTNTLKESILKKYPQKHRRGMLSVMNEPEGNRVIAVYSSFRVIRCKEFNDERVVDRIMAWLTAIPFDIAVSYVVPSTRHSVLLNNFLLVRICGTNLHSSAGCLLSEGSIIECTHNVTSPHQYVADYLTAVIYNNHHSYLRALSIQHSEALKNTISYLTSLIIFSISRNTIGSEVADDIAVVLSYNPKLEYFYIDGNNLGTSGAIKIARALQNTSSLLEFTISSNNIGSEAADDIAAVLSHNTQIEYFKIENNNLYAIDVIKILRALRDNESLTKFYISFMNVSTKKVCDSRIFIQHGKLSIHGDSIYTTIQARALDYALSQHTCIERNVIDSEAAKDIPVVLCKLHSFNLNGIDFTTAKHDVLKLLTVLMCATSSLQIFNLYGITIDSETVDIIAESVSRNTKLQTIYIPNINLETSGAIKIARALCNTSLLTKLVISNNKIGSEAADDIAAVLSHNTELQEFCIDNNNIETSGAVKIARGLENTSSLTEFDISSNNIGSEAAGDIAMVLSHITQIRRLSIDKNNLNAAGVIKIIRALRNSKSLEEFSISVTDISNGDVYDIEICFDDYNDDISILSISGYNVNVTNTSKVLNYCSYLHDLSNDVDSGAIKDIAVVLCLCNVQSFYLDKINFKTMEWNVRRLLRVLMQSTSSLIEFRVTNSTIDSEAADDIAEAVSHNTKLQQFCFRDNNLETAGAIKIVRALHNTSALTNFSISNNNIGCEAADDIATILSRNTKIQTLCIRDNNLKTSGSIKVVRALLGTSSLKEFSISNNDISLEAADDIAAVLFLNTKLELLYVRDNNLETAGIIKVVRALHRTSSLTEFNISHNNIGSEAADDIAAVLSNNTELRRFYIHDNNIETPGAIKIARVLHITSRLSDINISNNNIGSKAASDITAVLCGNTHYEYFQGGNSDSCSMKFLQGMAIRGGLFHFSASFIDARSHITNVLMRLGCLSIHGNNVGAVKIARAFTWITSDAIFKNRTDSEDFKEFAEFEAYKMAIMPHYIEMCHMHNNDFDSVNGTEILQAFMHCILSLSTLSISHNNIGGDAAGDIAVILSHNTDLQELYFDNNIVQTSSVIKIARGLQNTSSLKEFNISNNNIGNEAADDIAAVLYHNTDLQKFYIQGNNLETSGAIKIARALQNISSLTEFDISSNSIGSGAVDDIATVLSHNTKLLKFHIHNNDLDVSGVAKLTKDLHSKSSLIEFTISNNDVGNEAAQNLKITTSNTMEFHDSDGTHVKHTER